MPQSSEFEDGQPSSWDLVHHFDPDDFPGIRAEYAEALANCDYWIQYFMAKHNASWCATCKNIDEHITSYQQYAWWRDEKIRLLEEFLGRTGVI